MKLRFCYLILIIISIQIFPKQIELSLDLKIKEPENIIFKRLIDIATDHKNNIYVLDSKLKTIYLFSENGKFLRKIGRSGQGPGEFMYPRSLYIDNNKNINVLDSQKIHIYNSEYKLIRTVNISQHITMTSEIALNRNGNIFISGYHFKSNNVLAEFSSKGEFLRHFPIPAIEYKGIKFNNHDKVSVIGSLSGG